MCMSHRGNRNHLVRSGICILVAIVGVQRAIAETIIVGAVAQGTVGSSNNLDYGNLVDHHYQAVATIGSDSGSGECIANSNVGIGAKTSAIDNSLGGNTGYGYAWIRTRQVFTVTQAGTFSVPLTFHGTAGIPAAGRDYESFDAASLGIEAKDQYGGWYVLDPTNAFYSFDVGMARSVASGAFNKTYGLQASEYALTTSSMTWSATRTLAATLAPGDYTIYMGMEVHSTAVSRENAGSTSLDAYNSLRFEGGDFWSVVQGSAQFHDPADPSKVHVPEPGCLGLALAGLVFARRHRNR